jgi:hypothetical protein
LKIIGAKLEIKGQSPDDNWKVTEVKAHPRNQHRRAKPKAQAFGIVLKAGVKLA